MSDFSIMYENETGKESEIYLDESSVYSDEYVEWLELRIGHAYDVCKKCNHRKPRGVYEE